MHHILCRVLGKTSNHPGDSAPLQPRCGTLQLLAFTKTKITFEKEEISDGWWDSGKYDGAVDGNWENCVRSQGAYFEGDWGVTVPCTMFHVSSSINVSIFHSTWLDTFRTDHIHTHTHIYTYICVYVYMYMYIYIYMYVCVCIYISIYIYIYDMIPLIWSSKPGKTNLWCQTSELCCPWPR